MIGWRDRLHQQRDFNLYITHHPKPWQLWNTLELCTAECYH
jgi:hypothetical protein